MDIFRILNLKILTQIRNLSKPLRIQKVYYCFWLHILNIKFHIEDISKLPNVLCLYDVSSEIVSHVGFVSVNKLRFYKYLTDYSHGMMSELSVISEQDEDKI